MLEIDSVLKSRLDKLESQGLLRKIRWVESPQADSIICENKRIINFSSNDYLNLANNPKLKRAVIFAINDWGVGSGASRLISGSLSIHNQLEEALADFKKTESAIVFSSGYATALGTIPALVGKNDIIILDKLCHACLIDAAKLSDAQIRVFKHNDLNDLESKLKWARSKLASVKEHRTILIITESVFSMDGDLAPLKDMVKLKDQYGAWLLVDEAHATGLYGQTGAGLIEHLGLTGQIEIQMGTLSKAVGSAGGFICGSNILIQYLRNNARSFIFSTSIPPGQAAAAFFALNLILSPEGQNLRNLLWQRIEQFKIGLQNIGFKSSNGASAIFPIIIGSEKKTMETFETLFNLGYWAPAIRYPSVPKNSARLRVSLSAGHTVSEIEGFIGALKLVLQKLT